MGDYKPQVGDRVRVTFEGTWDNDSRDAGEGVALGAGYKLYRGYALDRAVSIEKIEPPVEVFGPGDVVRSKVDPDRLYTIAKGGYIGHSSQRFYRDDLDPFTSEHYERVTLS